MRLKWFKMVKIENIIRNGNNIISMDCYEEGDIESLSSGHMSVLQAATRQ